MYNKKTTVNKSNDKLEKSIHNTCHNKKKSHIYNEHLKTWGEKTKNPIEKWEEDINTLNRDIKMALKYLKTYPTSLIIGQM